MKMKDDEMKDDGMFPPEQQLDMDAAEDLGDMDGYAEGNESMTDEAAKPMEKPALADIVPDANTDTESRLAAIENQLRSLRDAETETPPSMPGEPPQPGGSEWTQFATDYPDIAGPIGPEINTRPLGSPSADSKEEASAPERHCFSFPHSFSNIFSS